MTDVKNYIPWANAGGPNECSHGYAAGIPCPDCDRVAEVDRLTKERDEALGNADFWERELNNFRRNAAHRAEQLAKEKIEAAEQRISELTSANEKLKEDAKSWKSHWQMYRDAWVRELGGWIFPKSHEIDALVLTTRKRCVNPILGNCNVPHWLGKPTEDRKALQQTPHPEESRCEGWKADVSDANEEKAKKIAYLLKTFYDADYAGEVQEQVLAILNGGQQ